MTYLYERKGKRDIQRGPERKLRPVGIDAPPVPSRPASRTVGFKVVAIR